MRGLLPIPVLRRVRMRLARTGPAAWISHLQQIDLIRRALMKSDWAVSMSNAKKTKPKVSFGPAISVGYESEAEYADVDLTGRLDMAEANKTNPCHPPRSASDKNPSTEFLEIVEPNNPK